MINGFSATPEEHVFPIVRIAANPHFEPPKTPLLDTRPRSEITITETPDNARRFMADLRVKLLPDDGTNLPYFIDVACFCFITVQDDVPEEAIKDVAVTVGHMIMYPAIRELILSITARQPWGQFSIGFSVLSADDETQQSAQQELPKKRAKKKGITKKQTDTEKA